MRNYDQSKSIGELENKDLRDQDIKDFTSGMNDRRFLNESWWKDIIVGALGLFVMVISNKIFVANIEVEGYPYKMLLAVLQPLGLIVGIRFVVGGNKLLKQLRR